LGRKTVQLHHILQGYNPLQLVYVRPANHRQCVQARRSHTLQRHRERLVRMQMRKLFPFDPIAQLRLGVSYGGGPLLDNGSDIGGEDRGHDDTRSFSFSVCASQNANQLSIAGVVGVNGEDNPILNAFLGNTFSGVVDTGSHIYSAFTGPDKPTAAAQVAADVVLEGVRQGVVSGRGPFSTGVVGATTDAFVPLRLDRQCTSCAV
jgi:hypothetical protein